MKVKIDGIAYTVKPMALHLAPYAGRLSELLRKAPADITEAEKFSDEIKGLQAKILDETVMPKPKIEHTIQLYAKVDELTKKVMREAGLFREGKHAEQHYSKGGTVKSVTSEASK